MTYSKVNSVYKRGERSCIYSYKPVSLLASFSKMLEKVMYNKVIDSLNSNSIIKKEQLGFWKGLSVDKTSYKFIDRILCAFNNKLHVGGILYDLAEAFYYVNFDITIKTYILGNSR
jgi:hypothetical protein